jgi:hypothetical protein
MRGPADLWSNIATNLSERRTKNALTGIQQPQYNKIAEILDNHTEAERLALSIGLSLRSMDISAEQITEIYNEQLVNHMASGCISGERVSDLTLDQSLFAHVHSFFMHLCAARDYLASLCALEIGKDPVKVDSFAKLVDHVRVEHFSSNPILNLFYTRGYFQKKSTSSTKYETAGWMKEVTELRNTFMHRRPYGSLFVEQMGFVEPVDLDAGVFRYVRPIRLDNTESDVQNVILQNYREITRLCYDSAVESGLDYSIMNIGKDDIISINV